METGTAYIIDATQELLNQKNKSAIHLISSDLRSIRTNNPKLASIILRGGGAYDLLLGLTPNDIDLFYSYTNKTSACECETVRKIILSCNLAYIAGKDIDLENSYEKEPKLSPIERTVGHFSFHTDYNSMFAIDENASVWTNVHALKYFKDAIYEIRYEGFLPWAYFPHEGDSIDYYAFQCYMLIRGVGYLLKRNLTPGPLFKEMLFESEFLVKKGIEREGSTNLKKYRDKKIPNISAARNLISSLDLGVAKKSVEKAYESLFSL
jgi:hypothetical protein